MERHWDGILSWHTNQLTNGLLEGINSLVQAQGPRPGLPQQKQDDHHCLTAAKLQLPTLTNPTPAYMSTLSDPLHAPGT